MPWDGPAFANVTRPMALESVAALPCLSDLGRCHAALRRAARSTPTRSGIVDHRPDQADAITAVSHIERPI